MVKFQVIVLVLLFGGSLGVTDILRKVFAKSCSSSYTMGCFKMDMIQLVELLEDNGRYRLLPGIEITKDAANATADDSEGTEKKKLPEKLLRSLARNFPNGDSTELDDYLVQRVSKYLSSHSLSLHLEDNITNRNTNISEDGARKGGGGGGKGGYGGIIAAAMMMKGMLATLGMGALAALAGKALMTGLMSLMLSAIIGLKSATSGGHKQTTYEIISKPVYSHSHSHSSEVQHDHGGHAGYAYGRNLDIKDGKPKEGKVTRTSEVQYVNLEDIKEDDDAEQIEYKTISEDDLKEMQKYGSYHANNIDYAALSGGTQSHQQLGGYRSAKHLRTQQALPSLVDETSTKEPPKNNI